MSRDRCQQLIANGQAQQRTLAGQISAAQATATAAETNYALALQRAQEAQNAVEGAARARDAQRAALVALQQREIGRASCRERV